MTIDGDVLEIELDMDIGDVCELKNFIADRLEYIEAINIVGEMKSFSSSSLLQLLYSIKKSKPSLHINVIDEGFKLTDYGVIHWIGDD